LAFPEQQGQHFTPSLRPAQLPPNHPGRVFPGLAFRPESVHDAPLDNYIRKPIGFHMSKRHRTCTIQALIPAFILYLALPAALADDWPITFAKSVVRSSAHGVTAAEAPAADCQPDSFDPQTTPYHASGSKDANPATYLVDGGEGVTMTINSRDRQDDVKITLPEPYSVTRYIFKCASGSSEFLEFKKGDKRYAIHAHVSQAKFTPDGKRLVIYNYAKPHHGAWQSLRRIFDIRTRRYTDLPVINENAVLADVGNERFVTYGMPATKQEAGRKIAVVWTLDGKPLQSLYAPVQSLTADQPDSGDAIGLLPDEPTTFYHLTRTGENECTLRLQDLQHPEGRRTIKIAIPGKAAEPANIGMRAQLDLSGLKLSGGSARYRVSASGNGNVSGDWGPWQAGE
jgi:hypothetical protein